MQTKVEIYPIERSPFWRLGRQTDLATLLGVTRKHLESVLTDQDFHYTAWHTEISGKKRLIACPNGPMRPIHERIRDLLNRIVQPNYLLSPRRGRSATMNAAIHQSSRRVFKIDIRQFYPSTTREHVFRFFYHKMGQQSDVAGALARLTTFEGRLPFGSPLSPVLCALVHRDMFDSIAAECSLLENTLTLWVDDLTISGEEVTKRLINAVRSSIRSKGFKTHKERVGSITHGIVITGMFVSAGVLAPSNKFHQKVRDKLARLDSERDPEKRLKIIQSLIGQTNYMLSIYPQESAGAARAASRLQWLHNERRKMEAETLNLGETPLLPVAQGAEANSAPWGA